MNRLRLYYFYFYLLKKCKVKSFIKYKFHKFNNYLIYYNHYNSFKKNGFFSSLRQQSQPRYPFYRYRFNPYQMPKLTLTTEVTNRLWNQGHKSDRIEGIYSLLMQNSSIHFFYNKLFKFISKGNRVMYLRSLTKKIKRMINLKKRKASVKQPYLESYKYYYRNYKYKNKKKTAHFYNSHLRDFRKKYSQSNVFTRYNRLKSFFKRYYKFYLLNKYNYKIRAANYKFKKRFRFWSIMLHKYNVSLLNVVASIYAIRNQRNTYNFFRLPAKLKKFISHLALFLIRLQNSISHLPIHKLKKVHLFQYVSFFMFHYLRNSINDSFHNYKMQYQFKTYKNYPLNKHFKRMYLRQNYLKKLHFQSRIFNYLVAKNIIFISFLRRLFDFYKLVNYKANNVLYYRFNLLIKYILNKWYPFLNSSKLAIFHYLHKQYSTKRKLKMNQLKSRYSMFCNYIKKVLKNYLFKNIHFKFYNRNIFITVTNYKGNVKKKYSIGLIGYKKDKKKTYYASQELIKYIVPYIFRFSVFFKYEQAIANHLFNSKYFNFYWNLVRKKLGVFKKKRNRHNRYIHDMDGHYRFLFINNLLYKLSKNIIIKVILKGTKYRMKGILNMFFKELYEYKKSKSFHVPMVLFFPLNNKPHNGCKYSKKKRKKRRRIAKKIRLRIKSKYLRRKVKRKKRLFYKRFRIKVNKSLYFVKRRLNRRNNDFKNKYNSRARGYKKIHFMPNFSDYKYMTSERRFFYKKRRRFPSRYKFKYKPHLQLNKLAKQSFALNSNLNSVIKYH